MASTRLTCGQHLAQGPFPQASLKREDLTQRSSRFSGAYFHVWVWMFCGVARLSSRRVHLVFVLLPSVLGAGFRACCRLLLLVVA